MTRNVPDDFVKHEVMVFVDVSGIAAIAMDPVITMAVAVAAMTAVVMVRMRACSRVGS